MYEVWSMGNTYFARKIIVKVTFDEAVKWASWHLSGESWWVEKNGCVVA